MKNAWSYHVDAGVGTTCRKCLPDKRNAIRQTLTSESNNEWLAHPAEYPAPYSRDYVHPAEYY
jgi:hypothetical protein